MPRRVAPLTDTKRRNNAGLGDYLVSLKEDGWPGKIVRKQDRFPEQSAALRASVSISGH